MSLDDRFALAKKAFACLFTGHSSNRCRKHLKCTVDDCGMRHHTLLHRTEVSAQTTSRDEGETCAQSSTNDKRVLLKIIPVTLRNNDVQIKTLRCWTPAQQSP